MTNKVSDDYEYLYHYTDFKGLCGILDSQCLWATHFQFLNDGSELQLFRKELEKYLEPVVREEWGSFIEQDTNAKIFLNESGKSFEQMVQYESQVHSASLCNSYGTNENEGRDASIYITSFSGGSKKNEANQNEDGYLSQWRSYGGDGGYSIVFRSKCFEDIFIEEGNRFPCAGHLSSCVYSHQEGEFKKEFSKNIADIQEYVRESIQCIITRKEPEDSELISRSFMAVLSCMTRFKHQGFVEENEVRAVILRSEEAGEDKPFKEVYYRESDGYQIPYIKLFEGQKLPIERIIVGPHKDKKKRASWLMSKLKSIGLGDVKVTVSEIPYIGNK